MPTDGSTEIWRRKFTCWLEIQHWLSANFARVIRHVSSPYRPGAASPIGYIRRIPKFGQLDPNKWVSFFIPCHAAIAASASAPSTWLFPICAELIKYKARLFLVNIGWASARSRLCVCVRARVGGKGGGERQPVRHRSKLIAQSAPGEYPSV